MELWDRAKSLLEKAPKMTTAQYVDESASLIADLLEKVDLLDGLLKAEQEDCQLQRANKNAEWQRAEKAIIEVGQLKQNLWPMKDAEIARWKNAYENMRDFAKNSGLDITCCG